MKLKNSNIIAIATFLLAMQIIALWCIDISVSAFLNGGILSNGFFFTDPMIAYHIGLYIIILTSFGWMLLLTQLFVKD